MKDLFIRIHYMIYHLLPPIEFLSISDLPISFFHFFFLSKLAYKIQRGQTKRSLVTRIIIFSLMHIHKSVKNLVLSAFTVKQGEIMDKMERRGVRHY